ncbi:hypothetical protein CPC08DRAFT_413007 [Agrocybe pediades]|nr:hypothetical protein CPC08DRAFT_413007 [Agrocybe pediades]
MNRPQLRQCSEDLAIRQTVSSNTSKTTHYDSRPLSKAYYKCMQSATTAAFGRSNRLGKEGTPCASEHGLIGREWTLKAPCKRCRSQQRLYAAHSAVIHHLWCSKWTRCACLESCGGFQRQVSTRTSAVRLADPVGISANYIHPFSLDAHRRSNPFGGCFS